MSWRRLRILIEHLPPESATKTALRNSLTTAELADLAEGGQPETARWSQLEQLVAATADAVRRVEYVLICANTDRNGRKPEVPQPIPRPGATPRTSPSALTDASADFLYDLINGAA